MWMIRAGERGSAAGQFLSSGRIAIGGAQDGTDYETLDHSGLVAAFSLTHPDTPKSTLSNWARQDIAFRDVMLIGDTVLTWRPQTRHYHAARVTSAAYADTAFLRDSRPWGLVREVDWHGVIPRDGLPGETCKALDRRTTLHALPEKAAAVLCAATRHLP